MSEAEFISFIKELKQFNLDDIQKRLADLLACEARVQELEAEKENYRAILSEFVAPDFRWEEQNLRELRSRARAAIKGEEK